LPHFHNFVRQKFFSHFPRSSGTRCATHPRTHILRGLPFRRHHIGCHSSVFLLSDLGRVHILLHIRKRVPDGFRTQRQPVQLGCSICAELSGSKLSRLTPVVGIVVAICTFYSSRDFTRYIQVCSGHSQPPLVVAVLWSTTILT